MPEATDLQTPAFPVALKTDILVIGAGQAGLSSAYHLQKRGVPRVKGFVVVDRAPQPGGAWQFRWPSLTLSTVNRLHDLPGLRFSDVVDGGDPDVEARIAVPKYFAAYEQAFDIPVYRPVDVKVVCDRGDRLRIETDRMGISARGIINATGTWESPYIPEYSGANRFAGRQLHTRDYTTAAESPASTSSSSARASPPSSSSTRSRASRPRPGSPGARRRFARAPSTSRRAERRWPWWKTAYAAGWCQAPSCR